jgi:pilus assembly protein CpaC
MLGIYGFKKALLNFSFSIFICIFSWLNCQAANITVCVGESKLISANSATRVAISSPSLADVVVVTPNEVLLNGKLPGTATLYIWDKKGRHTYAVTVSPDDERVAASISKAIGRSGVRVKAINKSVILEGEVGSVDESRACEQIAKAFGRDVINLISLKNKGNVDKTPSQMKEAELLKVIGLPGVSVLIAGESVVLSGWVEDQLEQTRAEKIASAYSEKVTSFLQVKAPLQVEIDVRVVEAVKDNLTQAGINWDWSSGGLFTSGSLNIKDTLSEGISLGLAGPNISVKVNALGSQGDIKVLANPKLTTIAGKKASVLIGGEFPVGIYQDGKVTVEWKSYGVKLDVEPSVNADADTITVHVQPEVSSLDWANAVKYGETVLPLMKIRRVVTDVSIEDGGTLVLGGLVQTEDAKSIQKIPILGDIPILGNLFKSTRFQQGETELMIFLTPRIIRQQPKIVDVVPSNTDIALPDSITLDKGEKRTVLDLPRQTTDRGQDNAGW